MVVLRVGAMADKMVVLKAVRKVVGTVDWMVG
jgi:hypothetical protein